MGYADFEKPGKKIKANLSNRLDFEFTRKIKFRGDRLKMSINVTVAKTWKQDMETSIDDWLYTMEN